VPVCGGIASFAPALADTVAGFDPASFAGLAAIEDGHFWFVPRNRLIVGLLDRYFPAASRLLEVGCGNGAVLAAIARSRPWGRLIGSELHPTGLANARARLAGRAEFAQMDARHIPARHAFDVIGAFDVLEHVKEDEAVLLSMRDALAPGGGGVVLAVPQHPWLWSRADEIAHHERRYRRGELERKVEAAGFRVAFTGSYTAVLLPLMAASRWLSGRAAATPREERGATMAEMEMCLPPMLNAGLRAILHAEVRTTLAGLRWPAGGSRIVVAVRD